MRRLSIALIFVLLLSGVGIWTFASNPSHRPSSFAIPELGVALNLDGEIGRFSYTTRTVQGVGPVAFVASPALSGGGQECELGALYRLKKADFAQYHTKWSEETLKLAAQGGDIPPQVKEFADSYLVLEPSQAVCSGQAREIELRSALLYAIGSAQQTAPAS